MNFFVYGQSVIYYNIGSIPIPNFIYGQSVLNFEYEAPVSSEVFNDPRGAIVFFGQGR